MHLNTEPELFFDLLLDSGFLVTLARLDPTGYSVQQEDGDSSFRGKLEYTDQRSLLTIQRKSIVRRSRRSGATHSSAVCDMRTMQLSRLPQHI